MNYNKYFDHTLLKPNATKEMIDKLINEAITNNFKSICVNPTWVKYSKEKLKNSDILVCCVIGFPLGANTTSTKIFETKEVLSLGADEIDMVINIGKLIDQEYQYVLDEISDIKHICQDKVLKVIIETCLLNDEQKIKACQLILQSKADYVKTSTGFSTKGATIDDIKLLKSIVKNQCYIKAAGGIKSYNDLINMINSGANRIGSSNSVEIIKNKDKEHKDIY